MTGAVLNKADATRQKILQISYLELLENGYQGMRIDRILIKGGLTKGAFYHHFSSKLQLAYSIIDEVLHNEIVEEWVKPLEATNSPIETLIEICDKARQEITPESLKTGCPLNNLSQEMSPLDEGLRLRIAGVFTLWIDSVADALARGQENGTVNPNIEPAKTAHFFVSTLEGLIGQVKCFNSIELFDSLGDYFLKNFVDNISVK